jgi:hypothetical protein
MARRPPWRLALIVLLGLLAVAAVASVVDDEDPPPPADPPEAFLDAWARSRAATFRSVNRFTRTSNQTDATITDQVVVTQRPPDILTIDRDGATGLVEDQRLACVFRDDELVCQDAPAGRTYEDDVNRQLETLEGYVLGDDPLYATTAAVAENDDTCFTLTLTDEDLVAPPLGLEATYCFSSAIGAPTRTSIHRVEADDETRVLTLDAEVTDADLDPDTALDP